MRTNLYISGALIGSGDLSQARLKYESCAAFLTEAGFSPYLPHQNTDPELASSAAPEDVFSTDVRALMSSDAVVAFLDEPSHGVGAEIAICIARNIPVVAIARSNIPISRFIMGMIERSASCLFVKYTRIDELTNILPAKIKEAIDRRQANDILGLERLL